MLQPRHRRLALALAAAGLLALVAMPAPAAIEQQRARLPPPARCADPIEGIWMGHIYTRGEWYIQRLEIHRAGGDAITGVMNIHFWSGSPNFEQPRPCSENPGWEYIVLQPAKGTYKDGQVDFAAQSWKLDKIICGSGYVRYALDHFTGTIDPKIQEFQSVNNDGAQAVNEPTVFRRVQCFDSPHPAEPALQPKGGDVTPPPFEPPRHNTGCGCAF